MGVGHAEAAELLGSLSSLIRTSRAATHRSSAQMGAAGTPLGVLKALTTADLRPGDLAAALQVAPSVISRALVPLEDADLVRRTTDPADGRATLIALTELGRRRLAALQDAYVERVSTVLDGWSDEEVRKAAALLRRLETALTETVELPTHRLLSPALINAALIPTELAPDRPTELAPDSPADSDVAAPHPTRKPVSA